MTAGQREVLATLKDGPLTTRQVAEIVYPAVYRYADKARKRLRGLEDDELVRRLGGVPYRWELTAAGREALEQ